VNKVFANLCSLDWLNGRNGRYRLGAVSDLCKDDVLLEGLIANKNLDDTVSLCGWLLAPNAASAVSVTRTAGYVGGAVFPLFAIQSEPTSPLNQPSVANLAFYSVRRLYHWLG